MKHDHAIDRFVTASFDMWRLSLTIAETLAASQAVIGARMAMFGAPGREPLAEFGRLVPEKAAAFGKAQAGAARALRTDAMRFGDIALLDWWESSIDATAAWWAPIHTQVMANARRLA
ncbi:hypothetical protein FPZ24_15920 [Sphingomonas panacisoli]|uniref:Phasin domain-containing protein n=1 Tax=Sphingomonas panacisoli TaxID=1813879 RepID=A0A5B8LLE9_9SPHN|nr:hypothetical protein [Sphingomonas panacisoli]QDZ08769.1 hypothetical protein FPZ24_15920 [Sphingomonas panacisoli]